ncbi:UNVERIFIED_CONTAM: hypothetical protein FKN15_010235 [Acipenser sinensis]
MVISKKQLKESALPSVQEVREAELEQESSQSGSHQLGGIASRPRKAFSRGSTDTKTVSRSDKAHSPTERASAGPKEEAEEDSPAEQEGEDPQGAELRESSEEEATNQEEEWDTDLEIDDAKQPRYPTEKTLYEEACKIFSVVPASYFLRHMHDQELNLMHHGLGTQGAKALSVPLVTNTSVLNLNLSDNWLEGGGGVAIAEMLKENCYITASQQCKCAVWKDRGTGFSKYPRSYFLRHMHDQELNLMHHGLGTQGAKALSVPLVTNTSVLNLNLSDNWLEGGGGVAIAEMLKENCYITGIDLSDNKLGLAGAQAVSAMLKENVTLVNINLCGNEFDDHAATPLAEAFMSNHKVQSIDLSHNLMGEGAGEVLGNAIAENTGMKELNLSWNCFREMGSIPIAKGLGANIFLRAVDLSYNGFGKTGAAALGEALKVNNVLEHLNVSNNRIPPEGAVRFAMGLKENKTLKTLNFSRNPMQSAGCYGIIKSMQGNPESAIEFLDFSGASLTKPHFQDITVNKDFDDLHTSVKEMFPNLKVIHGGNADKFRKTKAKHSPTQLSGPLYKLKQHMKENSLNLVDFFERVDEDKSAVVTRREFQQGLVVSESNRPVCKLCTVMGWDCLLTGTGAGIPSSKGELQQLMDTLDKDKNGEIDLRGCASESKKGWLQSLFVHKVDPRKDAHSNLLSKKESSNLYKIQWLYCASLTLSFTLSVHNVKPECLQEYNSLSKMLISRRNQLLLEFSFWNEPLPRAGPSIYELRSYRLKPGTMIEWGNNWARAIQHRQENEEAVGGFFTQIGDLYLVHHLWAYKDLQSRAETRNSAWLKPGWDENVYYTVPLIRSMESRIMIPLKNSPLQ